MDKQMYISQYENLDRRQELCLDYIEPVNILLKQVFPDGTISGRMK